MWKPLALALVTGLSLISSPSQPASSSTPTTDLASRGTGGWPQYRIPALTTTTKGTLVAAYDGRPGMADLPSHIAVLIRRSTDSGKTWTPQQVVRQEPAPNGYGDPSLLVDRQTGRTFLFYAASVNRGFGNSGTGNSDTDPNILHADYSYSDDDGVTWRHRRITSMIKNPAWNGIFASSGEGIQLTRGPHAGRLIQQYTVRSNGGNYAVSAYSDDHGDTWKMGQPAGPGADENKTVELSDGTVMLNVRSNPSRLVATSTDGGVTYTPLRRDPQLVDQGNNGSIMRVHPDAPADDPRSRMLLFSNTPDTGIRRNLTVKMSCDHGRTWPVQRVIDPGAAGYSTLTRMSDGRIGLLYERFGYQHVTFTAFDLDWLDGRCVPLQVAAPASYQAGTAGELAVTLTNQEGRTVPAGRVTLELPEGWTGESARVPALAPGAVAEVKLPFAAATTATGTVPLQVRFTAGGRRSYATATLTVAPDPQAPAVPAMTLLPVLDNIAVAGRPGLLDDVLTYWTRIANTGNTPLSAINVAGNLSACAVSRLEPGASTVCRTGKHTITVDDQAAGQFVPELSATAAAENGTQVSASAKGVPVPIETVERSAQPTTVPSMQEWSGRKDEPWRPRESTRIVLREADRERLNATAVTLAEDLEHTIGRRPSIVIGSPRNGDIALTTDVDDAQLGKEGYRLTVKDAVTIAGPTDTGVFYGSQTLLQLLKADGELARGTARDWPRFGERAQMLDVGRKYYPMSYLKAQIRAMAWQKLNTFHLHLTDWRGFRIQTDTFPGLTATDGAYSKADLRELQDYAKKYHVVIVPEVDLPGHATPITRYDPSLRFSCASMDYAIWPGGELGGWTLDITKPHTRQFVKKLLDEIVPLFDGPVFHVGGDEIGYDDKKNACPELVQYAKDRGFAHTGDVFVDFMNEMNATVKSHGKRTEMWEWWNVYGQRSSIAPDKDIVIDTWVNADPSELARQGYQVVATPESLLYVSPGFGQRPGQYGYVDVRKVYEDYAFPGPDGVRGYKVARWSDKAEEQSPEWFDFYARRPLQVLAERTWGGPGSGSVWEFFARADAVGSPPGSAGGNLTAVPTGGIRVTADSQETAAENGSAANAVDNNPYTLWHTAYTPSPAPLPHQLTLDLAREYPLAALRYLPRQDGGQNGRIAAYTVSVSQDGQAWREVASGTFGTDATEKEVAFPTTPARYVRLEARSSVNGQPFASAGEISLWQTR
ncbi:family 20 glycosylhydrolase [Nonomuraea sp. NPDC059194]|uniref:family 20 glycosylhydrolase n=1 Tax=Nonomuraea sp. NPDC059194 TaxID=3346764 RepID=UPI0036895FB9